MILAYFSQNLVAVATCLRTLQSEKSSSDWPTTRLLQVITFSLSLVEMQCSNFSPKIGCHSNAPLSVVYGSVTDEFPDSTNPISKPNSVWICCIQLKFWPFCDIFCLFWPKFGCHGNVLRIRTIRCIKKVKCAKIHGSQLPIDLQKLFLLINKVISFIHKFRRC